MLCLVSEDQDNLNNVNRNRAPPSSGAYVPIVNLFLCVHRFQLLYLQMNALLLKEEFIQY